MREGFPHHFTCFEFWPHVAFIQHWHAERVNRYLPVPYRDREREREKRIPTCLHHCCNILESCRNYCWLQQLLYYLSLCARVSDLPLLSCQDHHFSRDDLDGSDWHRHFWTPHLYGRGHRNLGRPCFPELSGFTM